MFLVDQISSSTEKRTVNMIFPNLKKMFLFLCQCLLRLIPWISVKSFIHSLLWYQIKRMIKISYVRSMWFSMNIPFFVVGWTNLQKLPTSRNMFQCCLRWFVHLDIMFIIYKNSFHIWFSKWIWFVFRWNVCFCSTQPFRHSLHSHTHIRHYIVVFHSIIWMTPVCRLDLISNQCNGNFVWSVVISSRSMFVGWLNNNDGSHLGNVLGYLFTWDSVHLTLW